MDNKSIAYMNIALIKYWCKDRFCPYLKPLVSSISLRSNTLYTTTSITKSKKDEFYLDGVLQDERESKKLFTFIDKVVDKRDKLKVVSYNNMPTAAGLASSASAYAALTMELNRYFDLKLSLDEMAKISSMGSGSAARSFFKIAAFTKEGLVYEIKTNLDLKMSVIIVSKDKKQISSREAMEITKNTSSILDLWVEKNEEYFLNAKLALENDDFKSLGENMEKSTMLMHETMLKSKPSFTYLKDESFKILNYVKNMRDEGYPIYFTTDAGPNVKVLYLKEDESKILKKLKENLRNEIIKC